MPQAALLQLKSRVSYVFCEHKSDSKTLVNIVPVEEYVIVRDVMLRGLIIDVFLKRRMELLIGQQL